MLQHNRAIALLAFGTAALSAQETRVGVQAGLALPSGDLSRKEMLGSDPGLNLGAHAVIDLGQGHAIRPRTDYAHFRENSMRWGSGFSSTFKASNLSLGVDYLYFVNHRSTGLYLLAGISGNHWKIDRGFDDLLVGPRSFNLTTTKLGYGAGVGFQVNRSWGMEAGYTFGKVGSSQYPIHADVLRLTATLRF
jgi:opacity protein-like surface antigen